MRLINSFGDQNSLIVVPALHVDMVKRHNTKIKAELSHDENSVLPGKSSQ
jgi:hypothetical protein